jgi:DUF1680 family protein
MINRRDFALRISAIPVGLFAAKAAPAEAVQAPIANPLPEAKKRWQIYEEEYFSQPLAFEHRAVTKKATEFDLGDVVLAKDSIYAQSREWSRGFMLRIGVDRMLHNFRLTAGLPTVAVPLGGLEAPTSELRGHWVGHYLSACALLFASTHDLEIKSRGDALVSGIAECQRKLDLNGYVGAFPVSTFTRLEYGQKVWAPFYTLHKLMAGLLDMHQYAANGEALEVVTGMAGWVDAWSASRSDERMQEILEVEFGGIAETLYNLTAVTKNDRWAKAGDRFQKKTFLRPLLQRRDELRQLHANTHIPQVIAAARRYELTGDPRFQAISEFFWETITESRTFAPGGSSTMERWVTHANHLAWELKSSSEHQECCCSYNMMKLTRHLYQWDPEPKYFDYYERNLLNHRLGTVEPKSGLTTYFLSMSPGAWKTIATEDRTFWCCNGTALEEFARLQSNIYSSAGDTLFVNLFIGSELNWKSQGVRLIQETNFPESPKTLLTIATAPATRWTMKLRVPSWTTPHASVFLNGRQLEAAPEPGTYLSLTREWKPGDKIELHLPMQLRRERLMDDESMQAFLYGPVVLAGQFPMGDLSFDLLHSNEDPRVKDAPIAVPSLASRGEAVDQWILPVEHKNLEFEVTAKTGERVHLKPLNQSWERFAVYFQVES